MPSSPATAQPSVERDRCSECSGTWAAGTCSELFQRLLALDHSRRPPWGPYHGVSVATYMLQHPSLSTPEALCVQWQLATTFLDGGISAVDALTKRLVARNRAVGPSDSPSAAGVFEAPPAGFAATIADLSVDGSFPARDFETRVDSWVQSTVETWAARITPTPIR